MDTYHFYAMTDTHLSSKTGRLIRAFEKCKDGQFLLITGDLTNDAKPSQFLKFQKIIEERIPDLPVFSVSGNHDYPINPLPQIKTDICDYPSFQSWLCDRSENMGVDWVQDDSGAYAVKFGEIDIVGLNATTHWRRFVFPQGRQLKWMEEYLAKSQAKWHIVLCHAPLMAHNPQKIKGPVHAYISSDEEVQRILDKYQNVIYLSGHTHISPKVPEGSYEIDDERKHLYVNVGSVCKADMKGHGKEISDVWADGNVMEFRINGTEVEMTIHLLHNGLLIRLINDFGSIS